MYCIHCEAEVPDDTMYCPSCGKPQSMPAADVTAVMPAQQRPASQMPPRQQNYVPVPPQTPQPSPQGGKGGKTAIIVVAIIAVAVVACLAILVFGGVIPTGKQNPDNANTGVNTESTQQPPSTANDNANTAQSSGNENTENASNDEKKKEEEPADANSNSSGQSSSSVVPEHVTINVYAEGGSGTTSPNVSTNPGSSSSSSTPSSTSSSSSSNSSSGKYMISDSSSRYLSSGELSKYSDWELYIARNEIYARHGRGFKNQDLVNYFSGKSWYRQTETPEQFDSHASPLNDYELKNVETIRSVETSRGSSYL